MVVDGTVRCRWTLFMLQRVCLSWELPVWLAGNSNFNCTHPGRGLKGILSILCMLLSISIVCCIEVTWSRHVYTTFGWLWFMISVYIYILLYTYLLFFFCWYLQVYQINAFRFFTSSPIHSFIGTMGGRSPIALPGHYRSCTRVTWQAGHVSESFVDRAEPFQCFQ